MSAVTEQVERNADTRPLENLEEQVRKELESAVLAHRNGSMVYQSLQNLNEVISPHYSRLAADLSEASGIGRVDGGFRGGFSLRVGD